jgi:DNA-binding MarR family transcriptional regulator
MAHSTTWGPAAHSGRGPWLASMAMWANFMQFIDAGGVPARAVEGLARLTNLPGMQRWGYVTVGPDPAHSTPEPPRSDWIVRPTAAGRRAQAVWRPLAGRIETRWQQRFGTDQISGLSAALRVLASQFDMELPLYLPVFWSGKSEVPDLQGWMPAAGAGAAAPALDLSALLSRVLLAFAIDFERESRLPLPVSANALRVVTEQGVRLRDLPLLAGVSKEAISMSLGFLGKSDCVLVEPDPSASRTKLVRLTAKGRKAQDKYWRLLALVEDRWRERFGEADVDRLLVALQDLADQRDGDRPRLSMGLEPYADGWRAHAPYLARTRAMVTDPGAALPHYPMVLHRGGYPDGS